MRGLMKIAMLLIGAVALALMLPSTPTYAVTCATVLANSSCTERLTNNNINGGVSDVQIEIDVIITNTLTTTKLEVKWISDNITDSPSGIKQFFYNNSTTVATVNHGYWWKNFGGTSTDNFGDFASKENLCVGSGCGYNDVTFSLSGLATAFPVNSDGGNFAVLIDYSGNTPEVWVSDGIDPKCKVPEPSVLLFMGVGLVAVGVWGRRRLSNRNI